MKITNVKKWIATVASVCLVATTASAIPVTLGVNLTDSYIIGTSIPGANYGNYGGQLNGDAYMATTLRNMAVSTTLTDVYGVDFYRSANNFGALPAVTTVGGVIASGAGVAFDGNSVVINLTSTGFGYLVAKWDGPNGGAAVWNIAGLALGTTIYIPRYAEPINDVLVSGSSTTKYEITGWGLLNPGTNPPTNVPDAGSAAMLLGAALAGLGMMARRIKQS